MSQNRPIYKSTSTIAITEVIKSHNTIVLETLDHDGELMLENEKLKEENKKLKEEKNNDALKEENKKLKLEKHL